MSRPVEPSKARWEGERQPATPKVKNARMAAAAKKAKNTWRDAAINLCVHHNVMHLHRDPRWPCPVDWKSVDERLAKLVTLEFAKDLLKNLSSNCFFDKARRLAENGDPSGSKWDSFEGNRTG